ncbi:hypothetical protein HELRODRAFT_95842 [Helobdella robusta]|uniref:Putative exosome complex component RRP41 n=1 Tax=Helobdella robusta TaxID=6412 RepID=T1G982_HELRO|nr:hypothetical protein HELRODRAFT_95842 [Helobdella robusta]ESN94698.1 hypothetical protein HELRODRAFT_95842 [Helobdella robusta]
MAGLELLSDEQFRADGRRPNEIRRVRCKMGVFKQADGSAYLEQGDTKVLAAVYGPHEAKSGKNKPMHDQAIVNCQYSMAVFSTTERKQRPRGDRKSTEIGQNLKQTFESAILTHLYPKSQINIYIEILQADGSNLAASINAATLALVDAGIPMKGLVCCCSAGNVDDTPLIDLNHVEESQGDLKLTIAMLPLTEQILMLNMNGRLHEERLEKVMSSAKNGCKEILKDLSQAVRDQQLDLVTGS